MQVATWVIHAHLHLDTGLDQDIGVDCCLTFFDRDGGRVFEPIAGVDVAFFRHVDADIVNAVSKASGGEFPCWICVCFLPFAKIALLRLLGL